MKIKKGTFKGLFGKFYELIIEFGNVEFTFQIYKKKGKI